MRERLDKPVLEPLMISFVMVVIDEFLEGPSEVALTEWHAWIASQAIDIGTKGTRRSDDDQ